MLQTLQTKQTLETEPLADRRHLAELIEELTEWMELETIIYDNWVKFTQKDERNES